jgi:sulfite dehydrogenase (cytochrome) subunit B
MSCKTGFTLLAVTGFLLAASCCRQNEPATNPFITKSHPESSFSIKGSVREMVIQPEIVDFPALEGKDLFMSYCAICHSLKYISMQPDFPRKTWEAEVSKMVVKYHAPIDSVNSKKIVDYLVAIKSANL